MKVIWLLPLFFVSNAIGDSFSSGGGGTTSGNGISSLDFSIMNSTSGAMDEQQNSTMTALSLSTSAIYTAIQTTSTRMSDNTGTINTSNNPISWSQLKDVPAGFSDGTDDGGAAGEPDSFILFKDTAQAKVRAFANIVASSSVWVARIPTVEVAIATVAITPVLATSKIRIDGSVSMVKDLSTTARTVRIRVRRGRASTDPKVGSEIGVQSQAVATSTFTAAIHVIDSPETTSEIEYTIHANVLVGLSSYTAFHMIAQEIPSP